MSRGGKLRSSSFFSSLNHVGFFGCFKTRLLAGTVISAVECTCPVHIWPQVWSPAPLERNRKVLATPITLALESLIQDEYQSFQPRLYNKAIF